MESQGLTDLSAGCLREDDRIYRDLFKPAFWFSIPSIRLRTSLLKTDDDLQLRVEKLLTRIFDLFCFKALPADSKPLTVLTAIGA